MNSVLISPINIALAFDKNFVTPAYVFLTSIFYNNKESNFVFHIIATGLEKSEIKELEDFIKQNKSKVFFYNIDENLAQEFVIPSNSHFTIATYYRLFFPALVPRDIDKLLYVDVDTIVVGKMRQFLEKDLGSFPVAAVADNVFTTRPELGIFETGKYFNAGVLLMNLPVWKNQQISEKAISFLQEFPEKIQFVDQDALNAVLNNNWLPLESKFNLMYVDFPQEMPQSQFNYFLSDKIIIHFSSRFKPWHVYSPNRLNYLYHYYKSLSPKAKDKKYSDYKFSHKVFFDLTKNKLVNFYYNHPWIVRFWRRLKSN
ncbi:glycosyltransferase family 8 protein [Rufibacter tibetensis]|uniref:Glycosyl transferase family 8 n=1 Tax=Rufibacter tibetensis TaxID=512763 RepID=A0A0P0CZ02_9BACT|nr:glycosyltransferase family 8 protein [Rufibacter tibetensis]ALI99759.1 hypothetical protein DC20_13225 [Rufibacter tibetensis]